MKKVKCAGLAVMCAVALFPGVLMAQSGELVLDEVSSDYPVAPFYKEYPSEGIGRVVVTAGGTYEFRSGEMELTYRFKYEKGKATDTQWSEPIDKSFSLTGWVTPYSCDMDDKFKEPGEEWEITIQITQYSGYAVLYDQATGNEKVVNISGSGLEEKDKFPCHRVSIRGKKEGVLPKFVVVNETAPDKDAGPAGDKYHREKDDRDVDDSGERDTLDADVDNVQADGDNPIEDDAIELVADLEPLTEKTTGQLVWKVGSNLRLLYVENGVVTPSDDEHARGGVVATDDDQPRRTIWLTGRGESSASEDDTQVEVNWIPSGNPDDKYAEDEWTNLDDTSDNPHKLTVYRVDAVVSPEGQEEFHKEDLELAEYYGPQVALPDISLDAATASKTGFNEETNALEITLDLGEVEVKDQFADLFEGSQKPDNVALAAASPGVSVPEGAEWGLEYEEDTPADFRRPFPKKGTVTPGQATVKVSLWLTDQPLQDKDIPLQTSGSLINKTNAVPVALGLDVTLSQIVRENTAHLLYLVFSTLADAAEGRRKIAFQRIADRQQARRDEIIDSISVNAPQVGSAPKSDPVTLVFFQVEDCTVEGASCTAEMSTAGTADGESIELRNDRKGTASGKGQEYENEPRQYRSLPYVVVEPAADIDGKDRLLSQSDEASWRVTVEYQKGDKSPMYGAGEAILMGPDIVFTIDGRSIEEQEEEEESVFVDLKEPDDEEYIPAHFEGKFIPDSETDGSVLLKWMEPEAGGAFSVYEGTTNEGQPVSLPQTYPLETWKGKQFALDALATGSYHLVAEYTASDGTKMMDIVPINVIKVEVVAIRFDHKGPDQNTSDGLNIRKDYENDLEHSGNGLGEGEWLLDTGRNEPALFVAEKAVSIKARFRTEPVGLITQLRAEAQGGLVDWFAISETSFPVDAATGLSDYVEMPLAQNTPNYVCRIAERLHWTITGINGQERETQINPSGLHKVFVVLDIPQTPWYLEETAQPWETVLTEITAPGTAAAGWCGGMDDEAKIVERVTERVWTNAYLEYDTARGAPGYTSNAVFYLGNFLSQWLEPTEAEVNCVDCANGVLAFSSLLGCETATVKLRGNPFLNGFPLNCIDPIGVEAEFTNNCFATPLIDNDARQGGFGFHAVAYHPVDDPHIYDATLRVDIDDNPDNVVGENPDPGTVEEPGTFEWHKARGDGVFLYRQRLVDSWVHPDAFRQDTAPAYYDPTNILSLR